VEGESHEDLLLSYLLLRSRSCREGGKGNVKRTNNTPQRNGGKKGKQNLPSSLERKGKKSWVNRRGLKKKALPHSYPGGKGKADVHVPKRGGKKKKRTQIMQSSSYNGPRGKKKVVYNFLKKND